MGNAPIQMGLKTDKTTYHQGETVTGTVYLNVTRADSSLRQYRGIYLSFNGQEQVEVRIREETGSGDRRQTHHRTERESSNLTSMEVALTDFASPLRVAQYEFPFEWQLPYHPPLASSFRVRNSTRTGHCQIEYKLTVFLFPQQQQQPSGMFFSSQANGAGSTTASQPIHVIGLPTRPVPEPLYLPNEATPMHGLCCCWRQGHVVLGWKADNIHLTPLSQCQLVLTGKNCSTIAVSSLRVQLVQTVHWYTCNDGARTQRNQATTLVDYGVDVSHLPQWHALTTKPPSHYEFANSNDDDIIDDNADNLDDGGGENGIPTSFQIPADTLDSYQGHHAFIQHTVTITAVTRFLATSPNVSYDVHIQRSGDASGSSGVAEQPMAAAWLEDADYHDVVLPPKDWNPDETVPVIHVAAVTPVMGDTNSLPMAQAVVVGEDHSNDPTTTDTSDPLAFARPASSAAESDTYVIDEDDEKKEKEEEEREEVMHVYGPELEELFRYLRQGTDLNELKQWPICQRAFPTLTQEEYAYLCQAATTPQRLYGISSWLANEINQWQPQGFVADHVTALLELPLVLEDPRTVVANLVRQVRDLETGVEMIAATLGNSNRNDAQWCRECAYTELERRKQQAPPTLL